MKHRLIVAGILTGIFAVPTSGQTPTCTGGTAVQDACVKAVDLVTFMTPQLSTALAGGNATLGQGGALGGLGHFALSLRGTAVNGSIPNISSVTFNTSSAQSSKYTAKNQFVPMVSADAAIGIWRGISLGVTHVGGIDALVTVTYLPDVSNSDVSLKTSGGNTKIGFGARVGLLEESIVTPGVSLTYLKRDLPTLTIGSTVTGTTSGIGQATGSISLGNYAAKTSAWRLTASKDLLVFSLSAGVGQDKYESSSVVNVTVNTIGGGQSGTGATAFSMTRTNAFVGAGINLFLFKLVGELGTVSGGSVPPMLNDFSTNAASSRTYFTLGLRFGR